MIAETYGVSPASAVERLHDWCFREDSHRRCTEELARTTLQFYFGEPALVAADGVQPHVELELITKVYIMRQIEQRRANSSNRNVGATASLDVPGSGVLPSGRPSMNPDSPPIGATQAAESRNASTEIVLRETFQRPVVFGYRSISVVPEPE
jgi:hypothetical protein